MMERFPPPIGSPAALALRNTRIVWLILLLCVLVTTLWPRLAIGSGESPIDKFLHAAAFGALTGLFLNTRWLRSLWWSLVAMAALGAVDETLQMIPQLGRSADLDDWVADVIGIAIAAAFWMASRPVGIGAARLIGQRRSIAADLLLARPTAWLHFATVAALGFAAGAPLGVLLDSWFIRKGPQPWQYGFIGGLLGMALGVHALWEAGVRAHLRRATYQQPCLACGTCASATNATVSETVTTVAAAISPAISPATPPCACCGNSRRATDWAPVAPLLGSDELAACLVPILLSTVALVTFSVAFIAIVTALRVRSDFILRADTWYQMLPADSRILGDIAVVALIGACGLAACRRRIAARMDRCGASCLTCGFDLRATAPEAAAGTCHECGGGFVRVS
ncbi:MAG: VanZ family protein [Planctomycetota bacterium]|nr:VanZ family protein [Planctomycetota bacterium]